jgi:prepilin-type N-terminal cleavage/methylation domain-containing protein/prepilin-type processing-associated H-X9-DG protein
MEASPYDGVRPAGAAALRRAAFTLVEMLVVVSIIGVLLALLMPAVQAARESARAATCKSNLRQFGVGLSQHAAEFGTYCSGAFDWVHDGAVTEVGWVADLMNLGIPAGKMLCPSNPAQTSATYNDLLMVDTTTFDASVNRLGSQPQTAPDGSQIVNPCRAIATTPLAPGDPNRLQLVQSQIYDLFYNTNYTASWWLVRSGVLLDQNGNLTSTVPGCTPSLGSRVSTLGPLTPVMADGAKVPLSFLPLLACGGATVPLTQGIGLLPAGAPAVASYTAGPVVNPTMQALAPFPSGTPYAGPGGWWAGWNSTLQDYRAFAPVHRGSCNILMADGSVQTCIDLNNDHLLNDGFTPTPQNGFTDNVAELPPAEFYSRWSLRP